MKIKEKIKYSSLLLEKFQEEGDDQTITVAGIAIDANESRNGINYTADELKKAAKTLQGKPIGMNHSETVESIIGKVESVKFEDNKILYKAKIQNTPYQTGIVEMVKAGLVQSVSVEALIESVQKNKEKYDAIGIEFLALDLVKNPGMANASISLSEAIGKKINFEKKSFNKKNMNVFIQLIEAITTKSNVSVEDLKIINTAFGSLSEEEQTETKKAYESAVSLIEKTVEANKTNEAQANEQIKVMEAKIAQLEKEKFEGEIQKKLSEKLEGKFIAEEKKAKLVRVLSELKAESIDTILEALESVTVFDSKKHLSGGEGEEGTKPERGFKGLESDAKAKKYAEEKNISYNEALEALAKN